MKHVAIIALAATTLLGVPQFAGLSMHAQAAPSTHQLTNEGRRTCKAIPSGWVGKVRGHEYGDYGDPFDRFNIRYCFNTRAQCVQFVNNVERIAYPVESISFRSCRAY